MSFKFKRIAKNISSVLNFAPNVLTNDLTITIYGGYQASICGYKKILVYDDNMLIVCNFEKQLKVIGSNLILSEMSQEELILKGIINSAEFENYRR